MQGAFCARRMHWRSVFVSSFLFLCSLATFGTIAQSWVEIVRNLLNDFAILWKFFYIRIDNAIERGGQADSTAGLMGALTTVCMAVILNGFDLISYFRCVLLYAQNPTRW